MTQFVAYTRVRTREQGDSRLGLEGQAAFITAFLQPDDLLIQPSIRRNPVRQKSKPQGAGSRYRALPSNWCNVAGI